MHKCDRCHTLFSNEDMLFRGPYLLCPKCRDAFSRFMEGAPATDMQNEILQRLYDKEQQRCRELEKDLQEARRYGDFYHHEFMMTPYKYEREISTYREALKNSVAENERLRKRLAAISSIANGDREPDADPRAEMGKELGV